MKYIIIFILIFCLTSCSNSNHNNDDNNTKIQDKYTVIKEINFNTGFSSLSKFTGSYFDSEKKKDLIYFADPVSKKCIKIFDFEGNLIDSVPITNIPENNIDEIDGISVFSADSIFLTSSEQNKMIHLNNKGEIFNEIKIDKIVTDTLKYKYLFFQSYFPNSMPSSNTLIFKIWPVAHDVMIKNKKILKNITSKNYFFFSEFYNLPYFVKISNIYDNNTKIKYGPYDLYKDIYGDSRGEYNGAYFDISTFFKYIGKDLFLMSSHSDHIYKIDGENLDYLNSYKIESNYTSIGVEPLIIENTIESNNSKKEECDQSMKELTNGTIENIFYNEDKKEFYVFVTHSLKDMDECEKYGLHGKFRPFSIIVYNDNFEDPHEYKFDGNLYCNRTAFVTDEGIMILKNNEDSGKQIFDVISFN